MAIFNNSMMLSLNLPVPNMKAWYDASRTPAGSVSSWVDYSGNGYSATQGTGAAQPTSTANQLNSRNSLLFDGGDTLVLSSSLYSIPNGANTIFAVAKRNTESGATAAIFALGDAPDISRYALSFNSNSGEVIFRNDTGTGAIVTSTGNTNTNYQILQGSFNGSTGISVAVNNKTAVTATTGNLVSTIDRGYIGSRTGSSLFLTGGIAELIIYTRLLTANEIIYNNKYLAQKWNIAIS